MPRYIDAELAVNAAIEGADDWDGGYNLTRNQYIECAIDKVPTADVVPVKRGKWEGDDQITNFICSVCGSLEEYDTNYCPNCGARMEGENDG